MGNLSVNLLVMLSGGALSLGFEYVPRLEGWYGNLDSVQKRLLMAGLVALSAVLLFGLSCVNSPYAVVECSEAGVWQVLEVVFWALMANQTTHKVFKRA